MEFTLDQRIHYNYLENYMQVSTMFAMAGLHYPLTIAIWGALYVLSRIVFMVGYRISPAKRVYAVPIVMGTMMALPIFCFISLA